MKQIDKLCYASNITLLRYTIQQILKYYNQYLAPGNHLVHAVFCPEAFLSYLDNHICWTRKFVKEKQDKFYCLLNLNYRIQHVKKNPAQWILTVYSESFSIFLALVSYIYKQKFMLLS